MPMVNADNKQTQTHMGWLLAKVVLLAMSWLAGVNRPEANITASMEVDTGPGIII